MNVKEAVQAAKTYVADLFAEEQIQQLGLEEVEFDQQASVWSITIGFSRAWDRAGFLSRAGFADPRAYKIVRISDDDGRVISVKDRRPVAA